METEPDNRTTPVFEFLFKIEPAGDFGLPVEGTVVTRAREGEQIYSATLDRFTGNVVSHGSLPPYREDTEAVHIDWRFDDMQMRLHDNFLAIEMSGEDYAAVETSVLTRVDRFLQLLSLTKGTYFAAEFIQATLQTASERELVRQPRRIQLAKVQTYNLDAFKASLSWSLDAAPLTTNPRLAKALDYFNHAQFLSRVRARVEFGNLNAQSHLAADIFCNFYKAASVIVGDRSKDRDFQTRYKKIGLSYEFWKEKVEYVRQLRNEHGVAHYYDLEGKQLETELGTAAMVAKTVIDHYIAWL